MAGKIFGNASEVRSLAKLIELCIDAISETNDKGSSMLATIEGSDSDKLYQDASEIVEYTKRAVAESQDPMNEVQKALEEYASFLEQHG